MSEDSHADCGEDDDGHEDADHVDHRVLEDRNLNVHELPLLHLEDRMLAVLAVVLIAFFHALHLRIDQQLIAVRDADGPGIITYDLVLVLEDSLVIGEETEAIISDFVLALVDELSGVYFGEAIDVLAVHLLVIVAIRDVFV